MIRQLLLVISLGAVVLSCSSNTAEINSEPAQRSFTFTYTVRVDSLPADGGRLDLWVPLPAVGEFQEVTDYRIDAPVACELYEDPVYGNRILHFTAEPLPSTPLTVTVECDVTRLEQIAAVLPEPRDDPRADLFLRPNRLGPITPRIAAEADSVTGRLTSDYDRARALYDHLFATMRYDKSGSGWGRGDALFACDERRGNCTDIHSLFIAEARSLGIPARFIIGFPVPPDSPQGEIGGYHCWAEFYVRDYGWLPVDLSDAIKFPERKEDLFAHLDPNRVAFTTGRDIILESAGVRDTVNYLIYSVVWVDGRSWPHVAHTFGYRAAERPAAPVRGRSTR